MSDKEFSIHVTHAQIVNAIRDVVSQEMQKFDYHARIEQAVEDGVRRLEMSFKRRVDEICALDLEKVISPQKWWDSDQVSRLLETRIQSVIKAEAEKTIAGIGVEIQAKLVHRSDKNSRTGCG